MSILGTRVLRTEDPGFLTTGAVYTEDVQDERLAGACYVHFVRSTVAHASILSVDVSAARDGDGVLAVYTGKDLAEAGLAPVKPMMPNMNQKMVQPLLATDVVRFVGEPVAAVVTEEMYQGEDAIELVDVDYGPLPAVATMHQALNGERGLLFPDAGTNVVVKFGDEGETSPGLFDGCEVVVSEVIQNQRVAPAPMESRSGAAVWGDGGRLIAWIPNQGAQGTKGALVGMLGLEPED
ncbi:MAG TPA: molybdopterin cofactor-binding domain-containing protein, partial [Acidimicrobiales bacterium]|nr:molybdopterin cofactor-binding domain-containing protein [Acidimicrobiales bacterium]